MRISHLLYATVLLAVTHIAQSATPEQCAELSSAKARLVCYDSVHRKKEEVAPPIAERTAPAPRRETKKKAPPIEGTVVDISVKWPERTQYTLDDGGIWLQIKTQIATIHVGDEVTLTPRRLSSSYLLQNAGGASALVKKIN